MQMASRAAEPRNTDAFDYSNYHTINEVSKEQNMVTSGNLLRMRYL